tara:strand:+ start:4740 stop:4895 length:156 start_codon:yes stop_codon:yes gene_type:complete
MVESAVEARTGFATTASTRHTTALKLRLAQEASRAGEKKGAGEGKSFARQV